MEFGEFHFLAFQNPVAPERPHITPTIFSIAIGKANKQAFQPDTEAVLLTNLIHRRGKTVQIR